MEKKKACEREKQKRETVFLFFIVVAKVFHLSLDLKTTLSNNKTQKRYFDPSTDSCREFPDCHQSPAISELAWDCGPCSAFFLDGGNGHCERAPGCSLSGGGSGSGGAAATVLASGRLQRGAAAGSAAAAAAREASSEHRQIADVVARNAVVYNLSGKGSVSVGMPPTAAGGGARRGGAAAAAGASSSSVASAAASAPSSSKSSLLSTR